MYGVWVVSLWFQVLKYIFNTEKKNNNKAKASGTAAKSALNVIIEKAPSLGRCCDSVQKTHGHFNQ